MINNKKKYKATRKRYEIQRNIKRARARWVAALRSGKYKQGMGKLYIHAENSYCCLGVACKVARVPSDKILGGFLLSYFLPISYRLGLTVTQEKDLVDLNDRYKKSFEEIADYIEGMPIDPSFYENAEYVK